MQFSITAFPALAFLATILTTAIAHPLNLLHSHHTHHSHHHLRLRLPKLGSNAGKASSELQHPLTNNAPAAALDISNVFINMTLTSSETSIPTSFLIPLRTSSQALSVEPTASTCHHPRTARISNIQYGTSMEQASRQFERAEHVVCYARAKAFRLSDGEIRLAEVGEHLEKKEVVSSFTCLLES